MGPPRAFRGTIERRAARWRARRRVGENPGVEAPAGTRDRAARSTEHWVILAVALLGIVGLLVLGLLVDPDPRGFGTHEKLGLPPCRTIDWWGIPCPGCGVTTSVSLAAHGDLLGSLRTQPFGLVSAACVALGSAWALLATLAGRDLYADLRAANLRPPAIVLGVLMAGSWAYKLAVVRGWFG